MSIKNTEIVINVINVANSTALMCVIGLLMAVSVANFPISVLTILTSFVSLRTLTGLIALSILVKITLQAQPLLQLTPQLMNQIVTMNSLNNNIANKEVVNICL